MAMSSAWEDQTALNIREWGGRRKQMPVRLESEHLTPTEVLADGWLSEPDYVSGGHYGKATVRCRLPEKHLTQYVAPAISYFGEMEYLRSRSDEDINSHNVTDEPSPAICQVDGVEDEVYLGGVVNACHKRAAQPVAGGAKLLSTAQ